MAAINTNDYLKDIKEHPPDILHRELLQELVTHRQTLSHLKQIAIMNKETQKEILRVEARIAEIENVIIGHSAFLEDQITNNETLNARLDSVTAQVNAIALGNQGMAIIQGQQRQTFTAALVNGSKPSKKTDPEWNVYTNMTELQTKETIDYIDKHSLESNVAKKPKISPSSSTA